MAKKVTKNLMTPEFIKGLIAGVAIGLLFWYVFKSLYGVNGA